ncbi:hypothetical protein D3C77_515490 [compost metagenome]
MCQIIGVKHDDRIILARHFPKLLQHPFDGIALASQILIRANASCHAMAANDVYRSVGTVVANDKYVIKLFRVIQLLQIFHQGSDYSLLVMRCYQHRK